MNNRKKRVLFVGEASFLATGFSTYWNEVIKRLHAKNEIEVAEIGSYASVDDPRCRQVPWKFYPAIPSKSDVDAMRIYHSNQLNQFGEGVFADVCFDFKPDIVCVPPGTNIETPNGITKIEKIRTGDYVISHNGRPQRVLETMRRQHIGNVIKIYPYNDNTCYTFTPEHPIFVIKSKKRTWKQRDVQQRHSIEDAKFIEAGELSAGDYVLIPIYRPENPHSGLIDVTDHLNQFIYDNESQKVWPNGHRNYTKDNGIPRIIDVTNDFARLLGYYVAEGSSSRGEVRLSFGTTKSENGYVQDVRAIIQKTIGLDTSICSTNPNEQSVVCCSILLSNLMGSLVGLGAHNKRVPDCIWQSGDDEIIKSFLEGLIKGDGCYKPDTISLCTVSEQLARQTRMLFARLGIKASVSSKTNKPTKLAKCERLSYDIECYGQYARMAHLFVQKHQELPSRKNNDPRWVDKGAVGWIADDYIVAPIRRIRRERYEGQVYNLEVEEDNSYVTGFAVHNCSIRDWWMDEFIQRSPLRDKFRWIWMPTIDGEPQRSIWLDTYKQCDGVLTYSEYGMNLLKKTGRPGTKLLTIASPGADLDTFKPVPDKKEHKKRLGIDPNTNIIGCFAPGTPVLMADWTYKQIEDVQVGEMVIDADGNLQNVSHTHTLPYHKPMLDLTVMGEPEPITLTEDHKILAVPRNQVLRWTTARGQKVIWNPRLSDYDQKHDNRWMPCFVEPKDLEIGDFWAFKIPDKVEDIEYITVADFTEQSKTGKQIPEHIPVNDHFLRLAGIYLANGYIKSVKDCPDCSIEITLNAKHKSTATAIIDDAKRLFGLEAKVEHYRDTTMRVSIHNVCVARMWRKLFGASAATKRIHPMFNWLPPTKQRILVQGWQSGDGCVTENRNIGISINLDMLLWMRLALLRNGIVASISKRNMESLDCYDNAKQQWRLIEKCGGNRHEQFIHNGYLFSPIKKIKASDYDGVTHDLTVENSHSYVVFCKGVHNTVMRNQARKIYYDLIEAFSMWVHKAKTKGHLDLVKKTFLYLHTSYPDVGYDIGKAIRDCKVSNKVLMTYMCENCHVVYPSFFAEELAICKRCGKLAAHPPNANGGVSREVLAGIINTFDMYVQYSVCLHPDTPVMTSSGWENIGDIKIDDRVVGRDGQLHRVYKTMRSQPDRCLDVTVKGRPWSVTATDNHPWLVVDTTGLKLGIESIVNRERYHSNRDTECPKLKFIYKRTDELQPGDLLATKIPTEEILPDYDLPFLNEDMAYYIGLFVADGHANETCGQCTITSHQSERSGVFKISQRIAEKLDKDAHQQDTRGRRAVVTNICDTQLRNVFRKMCYHIDRTKQLPHGCHLWPIKLQEQLVRGLMAGDGHQKKEWLNVYCTTSIHIAKMLGSILERLGWYYCCHIQYREKEGKLPMYRFEVRTDGQRKSHETLYRDGFVLTKVASSNLSDFDGDVITIDVEDDHNYNTICGMSHNCEGFGMPCSEAIACGVPVAAVDYSAMQDHLKCPTSMPIRVERFFWETVIQTEQKRALPDNRDLVNIIDKFFKQNEETRIRNSTKTRQYAEESCPVYNTQLSLPRLGWDRTAAIWSQAIAEMPILDSNLTWNNPELKLIKPDFTPPKNDMSNVEFIRWLIGDIWGKPELMNTHIAYEWIKSLNSGFRTAGDKRVPCTRKDVANHFTEIIKYANHIEEKRFNRLKRSTGGSDLQVFSM